MGLAQSPTCVFANLLWDMHVLKLVCVCVCGYILVDVDVDGPVHDPMSVTFDNMPMCIGRQGHSQ